MRGRACIALLIAIVLGAVASTTTTACSTGEPSSPAPVPQGGPVATTPRDGGPDDAAPQPALYGLDVRPSNESCLAPPRPGPTPAVKLDWVRTKQLASPMQMAQPPGDGSRWFIALRGGKLLSMSSVSAPDDLPVVADLGALAGVPVQTTGEGGLLGFAFHPQFSQNGRVYVSWTSADGPPEMRSRVGYITSPDGGATFTSYTNLLTFDQPYLMHKGGGIAFGLDGLLYLSFGDGGEGCLYTHLTLPTN